MMTPNLDATGHWWVGALVQFNFELEYQKEHDNTVADAELSYYLTGSQHGAVHWVESHDPTMVESDHHIEQEAHVTAGHAQVQMHVKDWAEAQREDPTLRAVLDWLVVQKKMDLKALLVNHACSKEGQLILQNCQNFLIYQGALCLPSTPKGKTENYYCL